ncbi:hypothetical protein NKJ88_05290 [Mesorhizobium sp. M0016]|uniref:hypothetical protein n=1 Tax=Mesorhizobium sp. M0016 TaxID=2956843 RepID=UPI00333A8B80
MRKLLLASAIAITSAAATIAPANAGGRVVIGIGNGYYDDDYNDSYGDHYDRYAPRPYYQYNAYDNGFRYHRYHRHHRHCRIELVKHWRHHHRIVEEIRVCER